MRYQLLVSVLLFGFVSMAQPAVRTFLPVNPKEEKVKVVAGSKGVYVIIQNGNTIKVISFDETLKEKWGIKLTINYTKLWLTETYEDELVIFVSDNQNKSFALLEIDQETGHYFATEYTISTPFSPEIIAREQQQFWISGSVGGEPVAFALDPKLGTFKTLPVGHSNSIKAVRGLQYDGNTKTLDLVLETMEEGKQAYLLRSIDQSGKVVLNQVFAARGEHLAGFHFHKSSEGEIKAVSAMTKRNQEELTGLAFFSLKEGSLEVKSITWKDLQEFKTVSLFDDGDKEKRPSGVIKGELEQVFFDHEGGISVSIETLEKDYEVRGLLQRQFDEQSLVDQVDLNRYGRRDFDVNETTLNDRVDDFSNTDATAYHFREMAIDRVQETGNRHSKTTIIKIDEKEARGFVFKMSKNINSGFSIRNKNFCKEGEQALLWVATSEGYTSLSFDQDFNYQKHEFEHSIAPFSIPISSDQMINYGFIVDDKILYLMLQKFNLSPEVE